MNFWSAVIRPWVFQERRGSSRGLEPRWQLKDGEGERKRDEKNSLLDKSTRAADNRPEDIVEDFVGFVFPLRLQWLRVSWFRQILTACLNFNKNFRRKKLCPDYDGTFLKNSYFLFYSVACSIVAYLSVNLLINKMVLNKNVLIIVF